MPPGKTFAKLGGSKRRVDEFVSRILMAGTMRKPPAGAAAPAEPGRRIGIARTLAVMVLAASLGACSSLDFFAKKEDAAPDEPADRLYNEGLYLLNAKKDPKQAVKKFEEVDRQHPYS